MVIGNTLVPTEEVLLTVTTGTLVTGDPFEFDTNLDESLEFIYPLFK